MRLTLSIPWLLLGCGGLTLEPVDGTEEILLDEAVQAVAAPRTGSFVVLRDGALTALDAGVARSPQVLATGVGALNDAAPVGDAVLLATDGALWSWTDNGLAESPTGTLLGAPVRAVDASRGRVALTTDEGVFLSDNGVLDEVMLDGAAIVGEGRLALDGTLWLATDDAAVGWSPGGVRAFEPTPVRDVAVTRDGTAWFATERDLLRISPSGRARTLELPEPAVALHAAGDAVWIVSATSAWHLRDGVLEEPWTGGLDIETSAVDRSGRLLLTTGSDVRRISVGRPLVVEGLTSGQALGVRTPVRLLPTASDRVSALSLAVDGTELALDEDHTAMLDPADLGAGEHTLVATATWDDGVQDERTLTFSTTVVARATWVDDVEPLHASRCAVCHEGDTATVLDGPEAWQERFDDILAAVTEQRMPLSGDPLEPLDLAVLAAWRDNGFPLESR